jgi:hypothetical protein
VLLLCGGAARAAEIGVHAAPESLTVGDTLTVELRLEAPAGATVTFPRPRDSAQVEVRDVIAMPPGPAETAWRGRYRLAVFGVGAIVLPPWPVHVRADTQTTVAYTDSIRLYVHSVLDDSLEAADIADLKAQAEIPVPLPLWLWLALGGLLVAALLVWVWQRRRRRRVAVAAVAPPLPAYEVALEELRKLESQRLPGKGRIKAHYVRLSEILRAYLERSPGFGFAALEETTEEILRELRAREYSPQVVDTLAGLCEEADLVKFAKYEPTILECETALARVRRFVLETCRQAPAQLQAPAATAVAT